MTSKEEISRKLVGYREDYVQVTGKTFENFWCPVTGVDYPGQLMLGHILNQELKGAQRTTVVQRKDVDEFFGSCCEAHFLDCVRQGDHIFDIVRDPKKLKRYRPRIIIDGKPIEFYVVRGRPSAQHPVVRFVGPDDQDFVDLALKVTHQEIGESDIETAYFAIDRNYQFPVIVSLLKAAHLTLFYRHGYKYVFSPAGQIVANRLGKFFEKFRGRLVEAKAHLPSEFAEFQYSVTHLTPLQTPTMNTSLEDGRFMVCVDQSRTPYALVVIFRLQGEHHGVFLPFGTADTLGTYFGFVKDPPESCWVCNATWSKGDSAWHELWRFDADVGRLVLSGRN
jgi:hypothetical protein